MPAKASKEVKPLGQGQPAPFSGYLYPPNLAAAVSLKAEFADEYKKKALESQAKEHAKDLEAKDRLHKVDKDLWNMKEKRYEAIIDEAPIWWAWFLAGAGAVLLVDLVDGLQDKATK